MNPNEEWTPFISYIEGEWLKANSNFESKRAEFSKALQTNEELKQQRQISELQIVDKLKNIRKNFMDRIIQMKQTKQYLDSEHAIVVQQLSYNPKPQLLFGEQKLKKLEMSLENPLKFDSISAKIQRIRIECENKSNILKDEIKKVKLRMSLCEMEYKELANVGKKKSD